MHTFVQEQKHHDGSHFIIRQGQAGKSDRTNNHFRESYIGRASPALRVNHSDVSVRGFYPKRALCTPHIRRHSTSSHQLKGPRRPRSVPCAAAVSVPGAAVAPAGHKQAGLLPASSVSGDTAASHASCATVSSPLPFPLVAIYCCCCCVALEMLQQQKFQLPVPRGDVQTSECGSVAPANL